MAVGVPIVHLDEIYKRTLLDADVPRKDDIAEIVRDHHKSETGMLVEVINDPHRMRMMCAECGQWIVDYFVEVRSTQGIFARVPGPHFMPITWLRRTRFTQ